MNKTQLIHNPMWKTKLTGLVAGLSLSFILIPGLQALEKAPAATTSTQTAPAVMNAPSGELANQAGDDFKGGAKSLGSGFKNGAKVTGRAFKKAGTTVGSAFKKVGSSIKTFFVGKKDSGVEEKDISNGPDSGSEGRMEPIHYDRNLDAVGDQAPAKAKTQAKGESESPNS